jgi:hypothetical protein
MYVVFANFLGTQGMRNRYSSLEIDEVIGWRIGRRPNERAKLGKDGKDSAETN